MIPSCNQMVGIRHTCVWNVESLTVSSQATRSSQLWNRWVNESTIKSIRCVFFLSFVYFLCLFAGSKIDNYFVPLRTCRWPYNVCTGTFDKSKYHTKKCITLRVQYEWLMTTILSFFFFASIGETNAICLVETLFFGDKLLSCCSWCSFFSSLDDGVRRSIACTNFI